MTFDPTRPNTPPPAHTPPAPPTFAPAPPEPSPYGSGAGFPVSPVPPASPVAKRKSSGGWLNVVLALAAIVAIGGVAFAVGRSTAPASAATGGTRLGNANGGQFPTGSGRPDFAGGNGGGFAGRGLGGGGQVAISGTVQSITSDTLTLTTTSGQTIQFKLDPSTTYSTKQPATASAVTIGSKVEVGLSFGAGQRPQASAATTPITGTAGTVTVVP